jgi:hypothetical protein
LGEVNEAKLRIAMIADDEARRLAVATVRTLAPLDVVPSREDDEVPSMDDAARYLNECLEASGLYADRVAALLRGA